MQTQTTTIHIDNIDKIQLDRDPIDRGENIVDHLFWLLHSFATGADSGSGTYFY